MGSMLEMSVGGSKEIKLEHGGGRRFLQDGDEVIMSAVCQVLKLSKLRRQIKAFYAMY